MVKDLKKRCYQKSLVLYLLMLSLVMGISYPMFLHYDLADTKDPKSYLQIAQGDFEGSLTRRYRVVIPFMAAAVAAPLSLVYDKIWPHRADEKWPLRLGFLIVNSLTYALALLLIFKLCNTRASGLASLFGALAVISSRWTVYIAGLPLTDSLYLLVLVLMIYGIMAKKPWALVTAIILGPIAKESFIFFVPIIIYFGRDILSIPKQVVYFILGGAIAFGTRWAIDQSQATPPDASIDNAMDHLSNISTSLARLFSINGLADIVSCYGLWLVVFVAGLFPRYCRSAMHNGIGWFGYSYFAIIMVHVLLSGDISRMFFLSAPVFALAVALTLDLHRWLSGMQRLFYGRSAGTIPESAE